MPFYSVSITVNACLLSVIMPNVIKMRCASLLFVLNSLSAKCHSAKCRRASQLRRQNIFLMTILLLLHSNKVIATVETWNSKLATTLGITTLGIMTLTIMTLSIMTLSILTPGIMTLKIRITTLSIRTLNITTHGITTLSILTPGIMTLSTTTLNIMTLSIKKMAQNFAFVNFFDVKRVSLPLAFGRWGSFIPFETETSCFKLHQSQMTNL
jgi:hypothetical protein